MNPASEQVVYERDVQAHQARSSPGATQKVGLLPISPLGQIQKCRSDWSTSALPLKADMPGAKTGDGSLAHCVPGDRQSARTITVKSADWLRPTVRTVFLPPLQIPLAPSGKSPLRPRPVHARIRGTLRDRHERWAWNAMDAGNVAGRRQCCWTGDIAGGRRSRVGLISRR